MKGRPKKQEAPMVQLPVYLPKDDHKALRISAIEEGRSATDIIRELVKEYLTKKKRKRKGLK